ncbi:unnamed protein product [Jaminaea pallidilutea]
MSAMRTRSAANTDQHSDDPYQTTSRSSPRVPSTPPRGSSASSRGASSSFPIASNKSHGPLSGRPSSPKAAHSRQANAAHGYVSSHPTSIRSQLPLLIPLTLLTLFVRLYKIGQPSSVVFDEVHFGGFAAKYINRKFFMDVHPPLAKLLIAAVAKVWGLNGNFSFKDIGREYLVGDNTPVPYVAMRTLPALLGVALVPLSYLTLRALSLRGTTALVGAALILFDNAFATQSRLILLDSFLVFFTAATAYCWVEFCNEERKRAFGVTWWAWLMATGFFLGCVASTKWVGFFTIATVGVCTIAQLWSHLGDVRLPMSVLWRHFLARTAGLIVVPLTVYLASFAVHLGVLNRSGEGDGFMSSAFQHTLVGHGMPDTFADVALGSVVTIRHLNTQGGLLHSHPHNYPSGSGQQQITLYPHVDENNEWIVMAAPGPDDPPTPTDENGVPMTTQGPHESEKYKSKRVTYLAHGQEVRLVHRLSDKRLHSHESNRPPITEADFQNEVTGYGFPGFAGDANDNWRVEIEHGSPGDAASSTRVRSLRTTFRLRHTLTGCYLFSHKIALPDWGFGQQEVTCNKSPTKPNSLWYVETSTHPRLSVTGNTALNVDDEGEEDSIATRPAQTVNYLRPSFLSRFWELQKVMWATNAGLTERHAYDSRPKTWPVLRRGINFWTKDHRQVYLIGNPLVWWGSTVAVLVYVGARALLMLREKRGAKDFLDSTIVFYDRTAGFLFLAYALHFFPFVLMSRQLFIHHYLPALYFAILLMALLFDLLTAGLRPRFRLAAASAVIMVALLAYVEFSPLTYANPWSLKSCERARWIKTWDFNCRDFPMNVNDFATLPPAIHTLPHTEAVQQGANATGAEAMAKPQPGQHAFEDVPKQAVQSGGGGEGGGDSFSIQPVYEPGDGQVENNDENEQEQQEQQQQQQHQAAAEDHEAVHPAGLDQEHVEEMVLEGTAGQRNPQAEESRVAGPQGAPSAPAPSKGENEVPPV